MTREIEIGGHTATVDVAEDSAKRYTGLSEKESLGENEGMLFVWPMEKRHRLVMRDMDFGVDMVFADGDGRVTTVHSADPDEEGAAAFSKYAVELPRGWCSEHGVEKGDLIGLDETGFEKSDSHTGLSPGVLDELAEAVAKEMSISMFAALSDETPDPTVEEVDAPYNEVEGECPGGDTVKAKIAKQAAEAASQWIPYQGPQGGEGWQNTQNPEDVRYQPDPPGDVPEEYEDMAEDWGTEDSDSSGSLPDLNVAEASPEEFSQSVDDFIEANPEKGAFLTPHSPDELEDSTLISAEEVDGGVAVTDGDVQNLHKNDGPRGAGRALLEEAIDQGGRTLDCYDGFLRKTYQTHGFREVGRIEFNPDYAPDGWNFDKYGQPDVVFMAYQPDAPVEQTDTYFEASEWDEAKDVSREAANWDERMTEKDDEIQIPEDEQDVIEQMEADLGRELTEQEKNLAIAQAELIGDL